jgi:hypothetical protein
MLQIAFRISFQNGSFQSLEVSSEGPVLASMASASATPLALQEGIGMRGGSL